MPLKPSAAIAPRSHGLRHARSSRASDPPFKDGSAEQCSQNGDRGSADLDLDFDDFEEFKDFEYCINFEDEATAPTAQTGS